jgi:hypothetical protein
MIGLEPLRHGDDNILDNGKYMNNTFCIGNRNP